MRRLVPLIMSVIIISINANAQSPAAVGAEICKWKDGKKAVYMLEFDDSLASQVTNAIPELVKRGMVGTFYIIPGSWQYKTRLEDWEKKIPALGMVFGNHTYSHKGAISFKQIDEDIKRCQDEINKCFPDLRKPRLVSFGQPGGVPWKITPAETQKLFKKYNLIDRPAFYGYPFWPTEAEKALKTVDDAIASGEMGHHDFHGVGGDYGTTPMSLFLQILDKLDANREIFWITDPVSWHQYQAERSASGVSVVSQDEKLIKLKLVCKTQYDLYDLPLSLRVQVPSGWNECSVKQGKRTVKFKAVNGAFICSVQPVTGVIEISRLE